MSDQKLRVYLRREGTGDLRKLASFTLRPTHDLYFSAGRPLDIPAENNPGGVSSWTVSAPDNWQELGTVNAKTSLHSSGVMHTNTTGGTGAGDLNDVFVGRPQELAGPLPLVTIITKVLDHLERESRSPTRGGANPPLVLDVARDLWHTRLLIEFFLCASGTFDFPKPNIRTMLGFEPGLIISGTLSIDQDRLIVARAAPFSNNFDPSEGPSVGFILYPGPGSA